jgi:hypothetical protein
MIEKIELPIDLIDLQYILFGLSALEENYRKDDDDQSKYAADFINEIYVRINEIHKDLRKKEKEKAGSNV